MYATYILSVSETAMLHIQCLSSKDVLLELMQWIIYISGPRLLFILGVRENTTHILPHIISL